MRHGREIELSYSGDISETTAFHVDKALDDNLAAVQSLLDCMGSPWEHSPSRDRSDGKLHEWPKTALWRDISASHVASFLREVRTHPAAFKVNGTLMADYIDRASRLGDVATWTVALIGKNLAVNTQELVIDGQTVKVPLIERAGETVTRGGYRFRIQRLLNPRDETIDLRPQEYEMALALTQEAFTADPGRSRRKTPPEEPGGPYIRQSRPRERALLLLYLLDYADVNVATKSEPHRHIEKPLVAFAASFPATNNMTKVKYRVNRVYMEQEYGLSS